MVLVMQPISDVQLVKHIMIGNIATAAEEWKKDIGLGHVMNFTRPWPRPLLLFHSSATVVPFDILLHFINWTPGTGY